MTPISTLSCGLYRTTRAVAGINADHLVYFHNHSNEGPPILLLPETNDNNRWSFAQNGRLVEGEDSDALAPLKQEGLYRVREHFHPDQDRVVAADSLVQLGYNRAAEPILFFPISTPDANSIAFPSRGMKIPATIYELLSPLDLRGPRKPTQLH